MFTRARIRLTILAAALFVNSGCGLLHRHHPAVPPYWVVDLGPLPGGKTSQVFDVNDAGQAVGRSDFGGSHGHQHAVLWEKGKPARDLDDAVGGSEADGISRDGKIVGWESQSTTDISACTFDAGPTKFFRPAGKMSVAFAASDAGIAVTADVDSGAVHTFLVKDSAPADIGGLPGYRDSMGTALSPNGEIVGTADNGDGGKLAFVWSNGALSPLLPPSGFTCSYANGVNRRGDVVGSCSQGPAHFHAVAWLDDKPNLLTTPPGKDSEAFAVDDAGEFVGQCNNHACLWRRARLIDLNTMIGPHGKAVLNKAVAINNQGEIACNGTVNKQIHAFLLVPSKPDGR